ncbi:LysR family transcriptional regulator [Oceanobacillus neutriphilus]|uniref:LysR family transcriptional regulator n=1 Tax=Oceanobacillus neutriphilus TaxID=531815 RepID=A0ABQ2NUJ3_9BACI|nr:LysR family transcriptional regulator [Oceanobacillus neutriphilus]GGP10897.1 LysR family transcriptional regulator [Oceanobacillus neutriphilus]
MNQVWLEAYIAIVEEKSITKAAGRLNLSQPALSKQVRSLESDLNAKLVTRSSKGIEMTRAGQYFYQQAQSLLQEMNRTREKLMKMQQTDKLTMGCLPSISTSFLPDIINADHSVFIQNHSEALVRSVVNEQIDAAFIDTSFRTKDVVIEELFTENYYAVIPKQDLPVKANTMDWKDIIKFPLILHTSPCDSRNRIIAFAKQYGDTPQIAREVPFGDFLYGYVLAGEGITIIPALLAKSIAYLNVHLIPVDGLERTIAVCAKSEAARERVLSLLDKAKIRVNKTDA